MVVTKSNNNKNQQETKEDFQKEQEKKAGTFSDEDCGIGFHAWFEKTNGAVICYVCGKVLYKDESEYPKP
jgi:ribosomal protein S27E